MVETTKDKPRVVLTRKLPDEIETRMMELFDVQLNEDDQPLDHEALKTATSHADVLVPTITDRITSDVITAGSPKLKMIANYGAGVDHIDLASARERQITITNTPDVLTEDTADMTMALILSVPRRLCEAERALRSGQWQGWSPTWLLGHRINGKRLGIIGMGRIGQAVAKRARGFGLSIHYHNRNRLHPETEAEFEATYWESLDQMLARMDIISVNCPHTPATYNLLSARRLRLIQPHAYLVNRSRGSVIDEAELTRLLKEKKIAGAGLDVYENGPNISPKLLELENAVLLPHVGSATLEGRVDMGEKVIINIKTFIDGHRPPDRVLVDVF